MSRSGEKCEGCEYAEPLDGEARYRASVYHCRRYPPHVVTVSIPTGTVTRFPRVLPGEWCGEHKRLRD